MQCACASLLSLACPAVQYFSILSHKWHDLKKKKIYWVENVCFHFFQIFTWNISHFMKNWARYDKKIYIGLQVKCHFFLSEFNETWTFLADFRKILKYQISWKFFQCEPGCSTRMGGRTDRSDEAIVRFSQFCERAKNASVVAKSVRKVVGQQQS